ncbi:hypothetical protein L7F22_029283 [Adiantum nelumboides]|nr:hypothetical protein [Adiantum nelumboides]
MASSSLRPGLSEVAYRGRAPMSHMDKSIIIATASLLGLLILVLCVLGICEWARKRLRSNSSQAPTGMNKRQLGTLPSCLVDSQSADMERACLASTALTCAICLSNFAIGDRIRVLPPCQHCFHVGCVDTWLSLHSSCPSCREYLQ